MDATLQSLYIPPRREGFIFHLAAVVVLLGLSGLGLWQVIRAGLGPSFLMALVLLLLIIGLVTLLLYRVYALYRARYYLSREGIALRWGLRSEDIPIDQILWLGMASDLDAPLPLPVLRWPGAVLGRRQAPAAPPFIENQAIEFLAANTRDLVIILTPERVFAITPQESRQFVEEYDHLVELGAIETIPARSVFPAFLLALVWQSPSARLLIVANLALSLLLLIFVTLIIPTRSQVTLGFSPNGSPREPIEAVRLLLLPVLNLIFVLANFLAGLYFFRDEQNRPLSYLLWGASALTPVLFLLGAVFSLRAG